MRFETLVPSGLAHKALVDTEFMGYNIPKGTVVMAALDAAMHDSTAWDSPHEFRPERFLDSTGKLCLSKDISLPFGAGEYQLNYFIFVWKYLCSYFFSDHRQKTLCWRNICTEHVILIYNSIPASIYRWDAERR